MSKKEKKPIQVSVFGMNKPNWSNPYTQPVQNLIYPNTRPVMKAAAPTQLQDSEENVVDWIACPYDRRGLQALVDASTILPQCIAAFATNIAGFGIGVRYIDDRTEPDAEAELARATEIIDTLSLEMDTKTVFEHVIEARETYGCAYLEVIRDSDAQVVGIDFIEYTPTILKGRREDRAIDIAVCVCGTFRNHRKRFCSYKQEIGGRTVYFKEFGDPRIMDNRSGEYVPEGVPLDPKWQANEIIEFAIGPKPYGEIRWRGNITGIDGARLAEDLNHSYFINGRHTSLLIFIRGGMLDEESQRNLQKYMDGIRGVDGQHAFIVLCAEPNGSSQMEEAGQQPDIEIKDLANILQKDELFQEYIDNKRRQVQSAFRLPDLYVGYTTDFNRATAQTARQVTEEQAFKNERIALAWTINNKLLAGYGFRFVEAYFKEPDLTNPDDLYRLLTVCNNGGGLTPNKAREIVYEQLGEQAEPYDAEWGDVPLQITQANTGKQDGDAGMPSAEMAGALDGFGLRINAPTILPQLDMQIEKAAGAGADDIVPVMKAVRNVLAEISNKMEDAFDEGSGSIA